MSRPTDATAAPAGPATRGTTAGAGDIAVYETEHDPGPHAAVRAAVGLGLGLLAGGLVALLSGRSPVRAARTS